MARLIVKDDNGDEQTHYLCAKTEELMIGRDKRCTIRTAETTVSRKHAKLTWESGSVQLVDLGSSNGTFFRGKKIRERWLEDGDVFQCGTFDVRFELDDEDESPIFLDSGELLLVESEVIEGFGVAVFVIERPTFRTALPSGESEAQFEEFNRQLEIKDNEIGVLRGNLKKAAAKQKKLQTAKKGLEKENTNLKSTKLVPLEIHERAVGEKQTLKAQLKAAHKQVRERDTRLKSLEEQILRVGDDQPTDHELAAFRQAMTERDQLLNNAEDLTAELLAANNALEAASSANSEATPQEDTASERVEAAEKELAEAQAERDESHDEAERLEGIRAQLEEEVAELKASHDALNMERDELHALAHDNSPLETLKQQVESLNKQVLMLEEERNNATAQVQGQLDATQTLEQENSGLNEQIEQLRNHNAEIKELMTSLPDAVELTEERRSHAELESSHQALIEERDLLAGQLVESQEQSREVADGNEEIAVDLEKALDAIRVERDSLTVETNQKQTKIAELEESLLHAVARSQLEQIEEQLATVQKELDVTVAKTERETARSETLAKQVAESEGTAENSDQQIEELQQQLADAQQATDEALKEQKSSAKSLKQAQSSIDAQQAELQASKESGEALQGQVNALDKEADTLREQAKQADGIGDLEERVRNQEEELTKAKAQLNKLSGSAGEAATLTKLIKKRDSEIEGLKAEKHDVTAASRGQMKRIAQLLKEKERLESTAADTDELETAHERNEHLQEECTRLEQQGQALGDKLESSQAKLSEQESALSETAKKLEGFGAVQTSLEDAEKEILRLTEEAKQGQDDGANLAVEAKLKEMTKAMQDLVEELNSSVSVFRQNCETVALCLEDIKNGDKIDDNHLAASEILQSTQINVDAIKKSLRKIRQEHLN